MIYANSSVLSGLARVTSGTGGNFTKASDGSLWCTQVWQEKACLLFISVAHSSFPTLLLYYPLLNQLRPPPSGVFFAPLKDTGPLYKRAIVPHHTQQKQKRRHHKRKEKERNYLLFLYLCACTVRGPFQMLSF